MHDKGNLLALGRQTDAASACALQPAHQVLIAAVGNNADRHALRTTFLIYIDLTVVAIAQSAIAGNRQEADRILPMMGNLLLLRAIHITLPDIEGAILLTQIIERLTIGCPYRSAVFTTETGQTSKLLPPFQPYITGDGTLMMLAEIVLIAFTVVIKHVALGIDADILHGDQRKQVGTPSLSAYAIDLGESAFRQDAGLGCRHQCCAIEHMGMVKKGCRHLAGAMGSQACGSPSLAVHHIDIHASLPI